MTAHPLRRALRTPLGVLTAAVLLLCSDYLIVRLLNPMSAEWPAYRLAIDEFVHRAGDGLTLGLVGAAIWGLGALTWRRRTELAGKWMVAAVVLVGFWSQVFKCLIGRPRPRQFYTQDLIWPHGPNFLHGSFPSGHAMTAFALVPLLAALFPRLGKMFFVFAAFIAAGRVYGGDHFPTDVLVGSWLGYRIGQYVALRWRLECEAGDA